MVRIKTLIDVITNSSSEVFLIKNEGKSDEEILELLENIHDEGCSGVGGDMSVYSNEWDSNEDEKPCKIPKGLSIIDIDWNKKKCLAWILENLFVLDIDYSDIARDKETGRVLGYGGNDEGGSVIDRIFGIKSLQDLKDFISEMSWKKGEKYLIKNNYISTYCPDTGFSEYNIDISPEDNIDIWISEFETARDKFLCELNL